MAFSNTNSRASLTRSRIMPCVCGFKHHALIVLNICVNNGFWRLSQEFIIKTLATGIFYDTGSLSFMCLGILKIQYLGNGLKWRTWTTPLPMFLRTGCTIPVELHAGLMANSNWKGFQQPLRNNNILPRACLWQICCLPSTIHTGALQYSLSLFTFTGWHPSAVAGRMAQRSGEMLV